MSRTGRVWVAVTFALAVVFLLLLPTSAFALAGTFKLNKGAAYTRTTKVVGNSYVTGAVKMSFKTGSTWSKWQTYASTKTLYVKAGDGKKTVYARYKSRTGRIITRSDSIVLDTHPPTGTFSLNDGISIAATRTVSAVSAVSGATQMRFRQDLQTWGAWSTYRSAPRTFTFSSDDTHAVTAQYRDAAGNVLQRAGTVKTIAEWTPDYTVNPVTVQVTTETIDARTTLYLRNDVTTVNGLTGRTLGASGSAEASITGGSFELEDDPSGVTECTIAVFKRSSGGVMTTLCNEATFTVDPSGIIARRFSIPTSGTWDKGDMLQVGFWDFNVAFLSAPDPQVGDGTIDFTLYARTVSDGSAPGEDWDEDGVPDWTTYFYHRELYFGGTTYPSAVSFGTGGTLIQPDVGGTVSTTGSDGTKYSLKIPPGALPETTTVQLVPIVNVDGLPFAPSTLKGVDILADPYPPRLFRDATLTVDASMNPGSDEALVGYGYEEGGSEFHLAGATGGAGSVSVALHSFSGHGVLIASKAVLGNFLEFGMPRSPAKAFEQDLSTASGADRYRRTEQWAYVVFSCLATADEYPEALDEAWDLAKRWLIAADVVRLPESDVESVRSVLRHTVLHCVGWCKNKDRPNAARVWRWYNMAAHPYPGYYGLRTADYESMRQSLLDSSNYTVALKSTKRLQGTVWDGGSYAVPWVALQLKFNPGLIRNPERSLDGIVDHYYNADEVMTWYATKYPRKLGEWSIWTPEKTSDTALIRIKIDPKYRGFHDDRYWRTPVIGATTPEPYVRLGVANVNSRFRGDLLGYYQDGTRDPISDTAISTKWEGGSQATWGSDDGRWTYDFMDKQIDADTPIYWIYSPNREDYNLDDGFWLALYHYQDLNERMPNTTDTVRIVDDAVDFEFNRAPSIVGP